MKRVIVFGMLILMLSLPFGCGVEQRDEQKISHQSPRETLTAEQLYKDYAENAKQAAGKYQRKVIVVTGTVGTTGVSLTGSPWVKLNTGSTSISVECLFSSKHKEDISKLKQGQQVSIKGIVGNKMQNIFLHGCTVQ